MRRTQPGIDRVKNEKVHLSYLLYKMFQPHGIDKTLILRSQLRCSKTFLQGICLGLALLHHVTIKSTMLSLQLRVISSI